MNDTPSAEQMFRMLMDRMEKDLVVRAVKTSVMLVGSADDDTPSYLLSFAGYDVKRGPEDDPVGVHIEVKLEQFATLFEGMSEAFLADVHHRKTGERTHVDMSGNTTHEPMPPR